MKMEVIKKYAIVVEPEDWKSLYSLRDSFKNICESMDRCKECPLEPICDNFGVIPDGYLQSIIDVLED